MAGPDKEQSASLSASPPPLLRSSSKMAPLLAAVALLCLGTPALASPVVVEQRQAAPGVVEIPVVATLANTTAAEIVAADHARLDRYFGPRSANEKRQSVVPAQNVL